MYITLTDLIAFASLIVDVITLVYIIAKRKK